MIIILGLIGVLRNILEVLIGGKWANAWFAIKPDIFLTMFAYPIFLCFFSATILHFLSKKFNLKIKMKNILAILFFIQFIHLIIPFFDGAADILNIPYHFIISNNTYIALIFSPIALTPLIIFFTFPTSFGIDIAWIIVAFTLSNIYIKQFKLPILKSLIVLSITFYIVYMTIYPVYYFFLNELIIGSNYLFGLFFLLISIPSIIYVTYAKNKA